MDYEESKIQQSCVLWFRLCYPKMAKLLFAVPNGGARSVRGGAKLKAEGMTAGVADLILLVPSYPYASLCIEMKTAKGRQRDSQKEWQKIAEKYGNKYVICRSFDDFRRKITEYLHIKPLKET